MLSTHNFHKNSQAAAGQQWTKVVLLTRHLMIDVQVKIPGAVFVDLTYEIVMQA